MNSEVKTYKNIFISYFLFLLILVLDGLIVLRTNYPEFMYEILPNKYSAWLLAQIQFPLLSGILCIILLKVFRLKISEIGLKKEFLLRSILIGFAFSIPFVCLNLFGNKVPYQEILKKVQLIDWAAKTFYYFFYIALFEELFFRGIFVELTNNLTIKAVYKVLFIALLFGCMHIPFSIFKNTSFLNIVYQVLITSGMHIIFWYQRKISKGNIVGCILSHALVDIFGNLI